MNPAKASLALVTVAVTIAALGLWAWKPVPDFLRSRTSPLHAIEMSLEQLDNAKAVFATERQISPDTVLTREQLLPYLKADFWRGESRLGVEYHINAIRIPAEAVLKKRLGSLPPKTIIRFSTNLHGYEIVQPAALERK